MIAFVDTSNLFFEAKKRYNGTVNYASLFDDIDADRIMVYVAKLNEKSETYATWLRSLDSRISIRMKEPSKQRIRGEEILVSNFDVDIAVAALDVEGQCTFYTSSVGLLPLYVRLNNPIVWGINIQHQFGRELNRRYITYGNVTTA